MGLDISAYGRCVAAPDINLDEENQPIGEVKEYRTNITVPYVNDGFPEQAVGVIDRCPYIYEDAMDFRAGSYGSYFGFRTRLAEFVGYKAEDAWEGRVAKGPFLELINFSDCEGVIGTQASAKLLRDFEEHLPRAEQELISHDLEKYRYWLEAFRLASNDGFVEFH